MDCRVYVGNIAADVEEALLWELIIQVSPLDSLVLVKDKVTGQPLGFAFASFKTKESADYACKVLHGVELKGKKLKVMKAAEPAFGTRLFVANLDRNITDEAFTELFSPFGAFGSPAPRVQRDDFGASRNFGFVSFATDESAQKAISLNGREFYGKKLAVRLAIAKGQKAGETAAATPSKLDFGTEAMTVENFVEVLTARLDPLSGRLMDVDETETQRAEVSKWIATVSPELCGLPPSQLQCCSLPSTDTNKIELD
eukprot:gnl/Hemi2/4968_TR1721_c0_g4_i1.p1 gnl/Hemi2/4968_TR1721_c0_g4~~gnl/Hemi2/4968_TR1721_c0_g4_i1.p1  ORF type:complete len:256 (-),score=61.95 gnl/Hemi2/4968_TR1721_c0_g4_i1:39-806(-)